MMTFVSVMTSAAMRIRFDGGRGLLRPVASNHCGHGARTYASHVKRRHESCLIAQGIRTHIDSSQYTCASRVTETI